MGGRSGGGSRGSRSRAGGGAPLVNAENAHQMPPFTEQTDSATVKDFVNTLPISNGEQAILNRTLDALDNKIDDLTNRAGALAARNRADVLASNPAVDTGGIRSQSAAARERADNRLIANATEGARLLQERDALVQNRTQYIRSLNRRQAVNNLVDQGINRQTGERYTGSQFDSLRGMIRQDTQSINQTVARVETKKFRRL